MINEKVANLGASIYDVYNLFYLLTPPWNAKFNDCLFANVGYFLIPSRADVIYGSPLFTFTYPSTYPVEARKQMVDDTSRNDANNAENLMSSHASG